MPRLKLQSERIAHPDEKLAESLATELKSGRECGQPLIYETELRPDRLRVTVVWDQWEKIPLDERTATIIRAYELVEGIAYREKIGLASGLTVPEATAAGMLPYQVGTALRKGDPVTFEQCQCAMREEGASALFGPGILQLRFATEEEAEACRQRLVRRLPKSDNVWIVSKEISVQDFITWNDSAHAASA